jgi:ribosomal protein S18 acetylase RimI-like enzyme
MRIERALVDDAEEILTLQKKAYQSEAEIYGDFTIPPLTQTLEEIRNDFEKQLFLKAILDGKIVGSVRAVAKERTCYIGRLVVHPGFQNRGIGTQLMGRIEEAFKEAERFELFTGHRSERNLYLYQKMGYQPFKKIMGSERLTIIYLEKKFLKSPEISDYTD